MLPDWATLCFFFLANWATFDYSGWASWWNLLILQKRFCNIWGIHLGLLCESFVRDPSLNLDLQHSWRYAVCQSCLMLKPLRVWMAHEGVLWLIGDIWRAGMRTSRVMMPEALPALFVAWSPVYVTFYLRLFDAYMKLLHGFLVFQFDSGQVFLNLGRF